MSAAQSVIGYVPDAVAKELQSSGKIGGDTIEVPLEAGKQHSLLRVKHADVEELRLGPSRDGHTGIQIVLKANAKYETVHTSSTDLTALRDPGLSHFPWPGPIVIYVRPRFTPGNVGQFHAAKE
jgi:hypothetical protein